MVSDRPGAHRLSRSSVVLCALILSGIAFRLVLHYGVFHLYPDDHYIFMRYARNFAAGHGLVYNPGQSVMGFSAPLYALMTSGLTWLFGPGAAETAVTAANVALFVVVSVILFDLARRELARPWLLLSVWFLYIAFVDGSSNGMETLLFLAVAWGAFAFLARRRLGPAAFLAALALLTRPEGAFVVAAIAIAAVAFVRPLRIPWKHLAAGGAVLLGWAAVSLATYGTVIPQSILAKSALSNGGLAGTHATAFAKLVMVSLGISGATYSTLDGAAKALVLVAWLLLAVLFIRGVRRQLVARSPMLAVPLYFGLNWVFYVVGNPVTIWSWYTVPTALAFFWTVATGADELSVSTRAAWLPEAALVVTVLGCAGSLAVGLPNRSSANDDNVVKLNRLATFVHGVAPQAKSVMLSDIGIMGFRYPWRVDDLAGLVSKEAVRQDASGHLLSLGALVEREKPDVICLANIGGPYSVESHVRRRWQANPSEAAYFASHYRMLPYRAALGRYVYVKVPQP